MLTGTAVSELREDAFEVPFRQPRGQQVELFVIIPGLPKGGTVRMEVDEHARSLANLHSKAMCRRWLASEADSLRRNVAARVLLHFTFEYPRTSA